MIQWRRVALSYPCIACGAAPGMNCVTVSGARKYEVHNVRSEAASRGGWRSPEDYAVTVPPTVGHSPEQPPRGEEQ